MNSIIIHVQTWIFLIFGILAGLGMSNYVDCQVKIAQTTQIMDVLVQMPIQQLGEIKI